MNFLLRSQYNLTNVLPNFNSLLPLLLTRRRLEKMLTLCNVKSIATLEEKSEPTPAKEAGFTKVILGSTSNEEDINEVEAVMESVWILGVEDIEVVRADWVVDCICEGEILDLDNGRYLYE